MMNATLTLATRGEPVSIRVKDKDKNPAPTTSDEKPTEKPTKAKAAVKKPATKTKVAVKKPATPKTKKTKVAKPEDSKPEATETVVAQAAETTQVAQAPKPAAKPNPLAGLRKAFSAVAASDVMGVVELGSNALRDRDSAEGFAAAVETAYAVVSQREGFASVESQLRQEWYSLSFKDWERRIRTLDEEGVTAVSPTLEALDATREFMTRKTGSREIVLDILEPFWRIWVEVAGPAAEVDSFPKLVELLKKLKSKGYVESEMDRSQNRDKAVSTKAGDMHRLFWLPVMGRDRKPIAIMDGSWGFIQKAEKRAQQWAEGRRDRLTDLEHSATKGLTFAEVKSGKKSGYLYFRNGMSGGAILQVNSGGVRVTRGIGLPRTLNLPTRWFNLDADEGTWPVEVKDLYRAFEAWKKVVAKAQKPETKPEPSAQKTEPTVDNPKKNRRKKSEKNS